MMIRTLCLCAPFGVILSPCFRSFFSLFGRGAAFPSDPPFPTFAADAADDATLEEIWCPQGEVDPLEIIEEDH